MKPDEHDDWKVSFKYELKCCLFAFIYGFITSMALWLLFVFHEIIVPVYVVMLIGVIIWNIKSIKFSLKALFIELPVAIGSFWICYIFLFCFSIHVISID